MTILNFWPPHFNTVATLPCEIQLLSLLFASGVNVCRLHSRWRKTFEHML